MLKAKHFLIEVLAWTAGKPQGFTYAELTAAFEFEDWQKKIIDAYFQNAESNDRKSRAASSSPLNETIFHVIYTGPNFDFRNEAYKYILTTDALFKFIDHQELELARENAREAKNSSTWAIRLSVIAIIVSILVPVLISYVLVQDVAITENQWNALQSYLTPHSKR